jgi:hypothetical protein
MVSLSFGISMVIGISSKMLADIQDFRDDALGIR